MKNEAQRRRRDWREVFASLRIKLLVGFLLVALAPLIMVAGKSYHSMRASLTALSRRALDAAATKTATTLDNFMTVNLGTVDMDAKLPSLSEWLMAEGGVRTNAEQTIRLANVLNSFRHKDPIFIESCGLLDFSGHNIADTSLANVGTDESDRSYFSGTMETGLAYASPVEFDPLSGKAYLVFAAPVRSFTGQVLGVLRIQYNARVLQQIVVQNSGLVGAASYAVVLDENGMLLANGRYSLAGAESLFHLTAELSVGKVRELRAARRLPLQVENGMLIQNPVERNGLAMLMGRDTFVRVDMIDSIEGLEDAAVTTMEARPWIVAFVQPEEVFLVPIRAERRDAAYMGLAVALLVALLGIVAARVLANPIARLTESAQRVADGDLNAQVNVEAGDEIGQLSDAFNTMTARLREREAALQALNSALERRVTERTLELRMRNEQLQNDLTMAQELQLAFLPQEFPTFPKGIEPDRSAIHFCHRYLPTGTIGGDFFDIWAVSEHEAGLFICDVMGHGVRAALVTATLHGLRGQLLPLGYDPQVFLSEMNRSFESMMRHAETRMFASALYMILDLKRCEVRFANAGHPHPILARRKAKTVSILRPHGGKSSPALGLFDHASYPVTVHPLQEGDGVLLYTDGLSEVNGKGEALFGEEGIVKVLEASADRPCSVVFDEVLAAAYNFSANHEFSDDVCLVGAEVVRLNDWIPT